MTMRPEDIKNRTFANSLRGYDKDQVRSFLFKVAESSRELHEKLTATEEQLASASSAAIVDENVADVSTDRAASSPSEPSEAVDGSTPDPVLEAASATAEPPAESLAAAEQSIADRYGALGDRIAELLRSADQSATDLRSSAEQESAELRAVAETDALEVRAAAQDRAAELLSEARAIREEADDYRDEVMAGLANARLEQEATLSEHRAAADAEVETYRVDSINEIQALRSTAVQDADTMREAAVADGAAAIAEEAEASSRLREEAENDRHAARAELEEVRSEVSSLLEQARTQSEFIKQEADEIIRTKVRSSYEQAQARIDVLRNTEIASRERIVRAQTELVGALNRLDSEPAPALDPATAPAVIEEAGRRHEESYEGPALDRAGSTDVDGLESGFVDAEVVDAETVEDGGDSMGREAFEADIAEAAQEIDDVQNDDVQNDDVAAEDSLAAFFSPDPTEEPQTTSSILAGSFAPPVDTDAEFTDSQEDLPGGFSDGDFEVTEHVVTESADSTEVPFGGETPSPDASSDDDRFGAASLAEALPSEGDASEPGGHEEEDALARLVREAMQEAVDSARKIEGP